MKEYVHSYYKRCTDHEDYLKMKRHKALLEIVAGTIFLIGIGAGVVLLYSVLLYAMGG